MTIMTRIFAKKDKKILENKVDIEYVEDKSFKLTFAGQTRLAYADDVAKFSNKLVVYPRVSVHEITDNGISLDLWKNRKSGEGMNRHVRYSLSWSPSN